MQKHTPFFGKLTAAILSAALVLSLFAGCGAKAEPKTPAPTDGVRRYYEHRAAADTEPE